MVEKEKKKKQMTEVVKTEPDKTTQINFQPGGRVQYTPKNSKETLDLTREEFKKIQSQAGGIETAKTKRADELNAIASEQTKIEKDQQKKSYQEEAIKRIVAEEPQAQTPTFEDLQASGKQTEQAKGVFEKGVDIVKQRKAEAIADTDSTFGERFVQGVQMQGELIAPAMQFTFGILENLRAITTLGGKDTNDVVDARQSMSQVNTILSEETAKVAQGADPTQALWAIEQAIGANEVLYSKTKQKGITNLRYWAKSGGKELELEAELNDIALKNKYEELQIAIQQGRIAKARAGLI